MPLTPSSTKACALLGLLVVGSFTWALTQPHLAPVKAAATPVPSACPCIRPRVDLAMAPPPGIAPTAAAGPESRRDRFLGRTAEMRDWVRAGRQGDVRVDLQAATLAIRNLGNAGGVTEGSLPRPGEVARRPASQSSHASHPLRASRGGTAPASTRSPSTPVTLAR